MEGIAYALSCVKHPDGRTLAVMKECSEFSAFLLDCGNQCAWTDRCCENVVRMGLGLTLGETASELYAQDELQASYDRNITDLKIVCGE